MRLLAWKGETMNKPLPPTIDPKTAALRAKRLTADRNFFCNSRSPEAIRLRIAAAKLLVPTDRDGPMIVPPLSRTR
jgi:hypothetical protein